MILIEIHDCSCPFRTSTARQWARKYSTQVSYVRVYTLISFTQRFNFSGTTEASDLMPKFRLKRIPNSTWTAKYRNLQPLIQYSTKCCSGWYNSGRVYSSSIYQYCLSFAATTWASPWWAQIHCANVPTSFNGQCRSRHGLSRPASG